MHGAGGDVNEKKRRGENGIFSLSGSDGLTTGDIKNINPMRLEIKKRNRGCCGRD